jgi:hypothetical protein
VPSRACLNKVYHKVPKLQPYLALLGTSDKVTLPIGNTQVRCYLCSNQILSSPSDILLLNLRLANARNTNHQDYAVKSIISGPEHSSMNANKQSGIYHITSVDAASINHTTIAQAGQKRTLDEFLGRQKNEKIPSRPTSPTDEELSIQR